MNEQNGEATFSIPLLLPPGAGGTGPDLALEYRSGARAGAGWLGLGWRLAGVDAIERDLADGVPYEYASGAPCGAAPCYRDAFALAGEPLRCAGEPCNGRFHSERHTGRLAVYHGELDGWTLHEPSGLRAEYGRTPETRIVNPRNGQVFAWLLGRREDPHGNWIEYEYEIADGRAHPREIRWAQAGSPANRSVVFTTEARSDAAVEYRAGFRRATQRNLVRIDVRAAAGALVTAYELVYETSADSGRSLLASVERIGADGASRLPAHRFTYNAGPRGFALEATSFCAGLCPPSDLAAQEPFPDRVLLDANGDALPDVYEALDSLTRVALHDGSALREPWRAWLGEGARLRDGFALDPILIESMLVDLDGDALLDWLRPEPGGGHGVRFGTGLGFAPPRPAILPPAPSSVSYPGGYVALGGLEPTSAPDTNPYIHERYLHGAFIDLTGDGRPDHVRARHASWLWSSETPLQAPWIVHPALGENEDGSWRWSATPLDWPDPLGLPIQVTDVFVTDDHERTGLVDWNADGLPDRLHRESGPAGTELWIALGNGFGFDPPELVWWSPQADFWSRSQSGGCTTHDFVDLNGDGYPDQVVAPGGGSPDQAAHPYFEGLPRDGWNVRLGSGAALPAALERWSGTGEVQPGLELLYAHEQCVRGAGGLTSGRSGLADFDGDGLLDLYGGLYSQVFPADGERPDLLASAVTPTGARVEFQYAGTAELLVEVENGALRPASPDLAASYAVPVTVRVHDGRGGAPIETRYHYADGILVAGHPRFGTVTREEPNPDAPDAGARVVTSYRTDRACAGRVAAREVRALDDDALLLREDWAYATGAEPTAATWDEQWTWCWPSAHTLAAVEGGGEVALRTRTEWLYGRSPGASQGQPVETRELGAVGPTGLDLDADDNRYTYVGYTRRDGPAQALQPQPAEILVTAAPWGDPLSHTRIEYDGLALGHASAGRATGVLERLFDASGPWSGAWIERSVAYDAWGAVASERGPATPASPDGLLTERASDSVYRSFPAWRRVGGDTSTPLETRLFYDGCAGGMPPPALGLPCRSRDPHGAETRYGYDAFGRVVRIEHPSGLVEVHEHEVSADEPAATLLHRTLETGSDALVFEQHADGLGRVFLERAPGETGESIELELRYDARGRLAGESVAHFAGEAAAERSVVHDALGRVVSRSEADGQTRVLFTYVPGRVIEEVWLGSSLASSSVRQNDARGRLVGVAQPTDPGSGANDAAIAASYDALGRLVRIEQGGVETRLRYDSLGRRVRLDDPESGTWQFAYDAAGHLLERRDGAGRTQSFGYDALGRVSALSFAPSGDGVEDAGFVYGSDPEDPSYGRLVAIDSAGAGTDFAYTWDGAGRLVAEEQTTLGLPFVNQYAYDALGRLSARTFPDGEAYAYTWSGTRLERIEGPVVVLLAASYDARGRTLALEVGASGPTAPPAVQLLRGYDPASGRLERVRALAGAAPALDLALAFDGLERLTSMDGSAAGQPLGARSFAYDGLGRLVEAVGPWEPELHGSDAIAWTYEYDALGNLAAQHSSGDRERGFAHDDPAHPRFLTGFTPSDGPAQAMVANAAGETAAIDGQPLAWNAAGRLHRPAGAPDRLHYDALGRRSARVLAAGQATISVGDDFEYDTASGRARKSFAVNGERIAARETAWQPSSASAFARGFARARCAVPIAAAALLLLALASLAVQGVCGARSPATAAPGAGLLAALIVLLPVAGRSQGAGGGDPPEPLLVYAADHLGSLRVVVDLDGAVVGTRDYLPFGADLASSAAPGAVPGFAGQPRDETSGLHPHGARMYEPHWARFLSPDESVEDFSPAGLHAYAYVRHQPTSRVDPLGTTSSAWWTAATSVGASGLTVAGSALSVVANQLGRDHPAGPLAKALGTALILTGTSLAVGTLLVTALAAATPGILLAAALVSIAMLTLTLYHVLTDARAFQSGRSLTIEPESSAPSLAASDLAPLPDPARPSAAAAADALVEENRSGPGYGNLAQQVALGQWVAAGGGGWPGF